MLRSRRNLEHQRKQRQRERKRELAAVRSTAKAELKAGQQQSAKDRLAYLMRQTDVFAHFIKPAGGRRGGAARTGKDCENLNER